MLKKWIQQRLQKAKKIPAAKNEKEVCLKESTRALKNPGCGWYHIYTFDLSKESSKESFYIDCEEEELVLLIIDIHAFRGCEQIPKEALEYFSSILTFFEQHDKGIILRIVYDTKGRGMENEPSSIKIVKSHMKQLGCIICEHTSEKKSLPGKILVHQGLFVGSWGEMHGSKFLTEARMKELSDTFLEATKGSCPIAVRKPVQLRILSYQKEASAPLQNASNTNFTLFNDAIFGSETDLGTYGTIRQSAVPENSEKEKTPWAREDELTWQKTKLQQSFCGGEVLGGMNTLSESSGNKDQPQKTLDWQQVVADLAKMHVSYLNSIYSKEVLDDWKAQRIMWNGEEISEYDYIGRHLGYRFVVTQVKISCVSPEKKKQTQSQISENVITLTIKNTGFANMCEEAVCRLILTENNENIKAFEIKSDPRTWNSITDTVIECPIPQEIWPQQSQQTKLFLQLIRKRDGRIIEWANEEYDHKAGGVMMELEVKYEIAHENT